MKRKLLSGISVLLAGIVLFGMLGISVKLHICSFQHSRNLVFYPNLRPDTPTCCCDDDPCRAGSGLITDEPSLQESPCCRNVFHNSTAGFISVPPDGGFVILMPGTPDNPMEIIRVVDPPADCLTMKLFPCGKSPPFLQDSLFLLFLKIRIPEPDDHLT